MTADGHIVLHHDNTLNRTTNETGEITEKTLEQLRNVDAAWNYPELRGSGITIPTLEEVLAEFTPTNVVFFFDIKDDKVVPFLPEIIKRWQLSERLIVGAVLPRTNQSLRKVIGKSIPIAPDFKTVLFMIVTYIFGLSWIIPTKHAIMGSHISELTNQLLTTGLYYDWKKRNVKIILFGEGLNEAETQRHCIREGVDILLTDRPDILKEVLKTK